MANVVADFEWEQCFSVDGTWSADEDSIYTTLTYGSESESTSTAYTVSGNTLTILDEGETHIYTRLTEMVDCSDYDFGGITGWTGTIGATVNGSPMNFGDNVFVEEESGSLGFGGFTGTATLAFGLDGDSAGSYTEDNAMATYTPNVADYMNSYVSADLALQLNTATETTLAGNFTFTAANISNPMDVVTVTGQFHLSRSE